jgi:hypothetical protein
MVFQPVAGGLVADLSMFDAWMLKASVKRETRQLDLRRDREHQALPLLRLSWGLGKCHACATSYQHYYGDALWDRSPAMESIATPAPGEGGGPFFVA